MIMEAKKSQNLQLASWRASKEDVYSLSLGTRKTSGVSSSVKANRLKTQEELIFQLGPKSRKGLISQDKSQVKGVPFYSREN